MNRNFETPSGRVSVVVDNGSVTNLQERNFRGRGVCKAGNFARWQTPANFLNDPRFRTEVLPALLEAREESDRPTISVEVELDEYVGWTAATNRDDVAWVYRHTDMVKDEDGNQIGEMEVADSDWESMPQEFQWRRLRRGIKAEFVTDGSPAPMTRKVTVIAAVKKRDWGTIIVVYSIRPGIRMPDFMVGHRGDIEVDESYELMFWDWEQVGDDPADPIYHYGRHVDEPMLNLLTGETIAEEEYLDD